MPEQEENAALRNVARDKPVPLKTFCIASECHACRHVCDNYDINAHSGTAFFSPHSHSIALVSSKSSGTPAHYLDGDDRILSVKAGAPLTSSFVLCVHMPGAALLEVVDSVIRSVSCCLCGTVH